MTNHIFNAVCLPATEQWVLRFLFLFRNGASACKYVCALKWFHDWQRYPISGWDTRALRQRLRGLGKLTQATRPARRASPLLWRDVRRLVSAAWQASRLDFALICVLSACFLFRVPSEALGLCFD